MSKKEKTTTTITKEGNKTITTTVTEPIDEEKTRSDNIKEAREKKTWFLVALFALIILFATIPIGLASYGPLDAYRDALITIALIATPLLTFFGIIWLGDLILLIEKNLGVIRTAITAAILSDYFLLLAITISLVEQDTQFPLQEQLVNSFTTVVGVLIAFYFAAGAYTSARRNS